MNQRGALNSAKMELEAKRAEVSEQITAYPAPITGCDAQFNHLLEERALLNAELGKLEGVVADGSTSEMIREFVQSCPFLKGMEGEKHE